MQRTLKLLGNISGIILGVGIILLFLVQLIIGFIHDTIGSLICLGLLIPTGLIIVGCRSFHAWLEKKNEEVWKNNKDLRYLGAGLACCSFILLFLPLCVFLGYTESADSGYDFHFLLNTVPVLIISFWAYLSLMFLAKNALFVVRSFLIFITIAIISVNISMLPENLSFNYFNIFSSNQDAILGQLCLLGIISLFIKGIIITFTAKSIRPLQNQKARLVDIIIIVILCFCIVSFRRIEFENNNYKTKEYPELNQSK